MISIGQRSAKASVAALLPAAVGPIRHRIGRGAVDAGAAGSAARAVNVVLMMSVSTSAQEQVVQFGHAQLDTARAAAVAFAGPVGDLPLAAQRVQFSKCQAAIGTD